LNNRDLLFLKGEEILSLLKGLEQEIMQAVQAAYQTHAQGKTSLPHSTFLRFSDNEVNRIIALPAYLGGKFDVAGIKWIASFPGNLTRGMERASAILILNSVETGHAYAVMESSVISAKRTAASAALAVRCLTGEQEIATCGLIGCGLINFETISLLAVVTKVKALSLFDINLERSKQFKHRLLEIYPELEITIERNLDAVFQKCSVVSIATTAIKPYIFELPLCSPHQLILHLSLRDLSREIILSAHNVVDDVDHVCRAQTSLHLAEQFSENRNFIKCTLGDVLNGTAPKRQSNMPITIFSPFGLGILDLALADLIYKMALKKNRGTRIRSFLPLSWLERKY
jgi:ornithine cyclodeaminase